MLASIPVSCALAVLGLQLLVNHRYGLYNDELYFIDCAKRLAWGYVDHPPLLPFITRIAGELFGYTPQGVRFPLAVAIALNCYLTSRLARQLGGGAVARALAAVCFVTAPVMLRGGMHLNIPAFEMTLNLLLALCLASILRGASPRLWLLFGVLAGIGILNKYTTVFFGASMLLGLALTPQRRHFAQPWIWLGGGVALLVALPNLIWQVQHGFPTIEFMRNINASIMQRIPKSQFIASQLLFFGPFNLAALVGAFWFYGRSELGRTWRALGCIPLFYFLFLLGTGSKHYYFAPLFPLIMAGGCVALEYAWNRPGRRGLLIAQPALSALFLAPLLPIVLPVLTLDQLHTYESRFLAAITDRPARVTSDYYNQLGWAGETGKIARLYHGLPDCDRAVCAILSNSYSLAGAINYCGPTLGLPEAQSGNNNYYLWGMQSCRGSVALAYGYDEALLRGIYTSVVAVGRTHRDHADRDKTGLTIYLCKGLRMPWAEAWPRFRTYR
ncbi:MAG: glycosyltransferase family 39 protein [Candidatus Hydrogenedentes bacterium]|nr:glycosyltransferase family 39 protein [Candidatus Hydrogenedentota bacterium]